MQVFESGAKQEPARLAPLREVMEAFADRQPHVVGAAAQLVAAAWPSANAGARFDPTDAPDIVWVARLGADSDPAAAPAKPFYLREPDARPQDASRIARR
jgi:tRNA threonylcarbamoyladenosine biosynthesis protein TsaB